MEGTINLKILMARKNMWLVNITKRLLDILISLIVLVFFAPFYGLIAIAIKHDSPGPVFYRGLRIGYKKKFFKILKFRTMYETEQSYLGPKVTAQDDPRITPLGHWLRDTKLNEFPQFWNVLIGEMSLVGPRPCIPYEFEDYAPWHKRRCEGLPGLTGLWQVEGKNHTTFDEMVRLDIRYLSRQSPWLDLKIMFKTLPAILVQYRETRQKQKGEAAQAPIHESEGRWPEQAAPV